MEYIKSSIVAIAISLVSIPAMAGSWVSGYGENKAEALRNAINLAEVVVATGGAACIDVKSKKPTAPTLVKRENYGDAEVWVVKVYTHNHPNNC